MKKHIESRKKISVNGREQFEPLEEFGFRCGARGFSPDCSHKNWLENGNFLQGLRSGRKIANEKNEPSMAGKILSFKILRDYRKKLGELYEEMSYTHKNLSAHYRAASRASGTSCIGNDFSDGHISTGDRISDDYDDLKKQYEILSNEYKIVRNNLLSRYGCDEFLQK